jgi:hypothetical protein
MASMPAFKDPAPNPELDRLVRELDQKLDRDFLAELRPALEKAPAVGDAPDRRKD